MIYQIASYACFLEFKLTRFLSELAGSATARSTEVAENSSSNVVSLPDLSAKDELGNKDYSLYQHERKNCKTDLHDETHAVGTTVKEAGTVAASFMVGTQWFSRGVQVVITALNSAIGNARAPPRNTAW